MTGQTPEPDPVSRARHECDFRTMKCPRCWPKQYAVHFARHRSDRSYL